MHAYKFLDTAGRSPFAGTAWEPGRWVESSDAAPCRAGVHACRLGDLAYWIAASMWRVELDGEIVETRHKVAATRARLVEPVAGYDDAMGELRELGAWRCRDLAVAALAAHGRADLAGQYAHVSSLDELAALGELCDDSTFAGRAGALAADGAHFALHGVHQQAPYVAAYAAGHAASGPSGDQDAFDRGYDAERQFQSAWLAERLGLT
jgi:hypothetical protein